MRPATALIALLLAAGLAAGDATPPAATKLVNDALAAGAKARQAYDAALQKERDRLAAVLLKEQERETKAGNLEAALAIRALIAEVKAGRVPATPGATPTTAAKPATPTGDDLLGDEPATTAPATVSAAPAGAAVGAAGLSLDKPCPVTPAAPAQNGIDEIPAELRPVLAGAVMVSLPRGNATQLVCTVDQPGLIVAQTGASGPNNAEIWASLQRDGFRQVSTGANYAWFTLQARSGTRFAFFGSPRAGYAVQLFAAAITPGR